MGQCLCLCRDNSFQYHVALKFPHGVKGIHYHDEEWKNIDINEWIQSLYKDNDSNSSFLLYNDETKGIDVNCIKKKGHCKGILSWNDKKITWLIHSVPNFPRLFTGNTISHIEPGEMIYGQSFYFMERDFSNEFLEQLITHILKMEPTIFQTKGVQPTPKKCESLIHNFSLDDSVTHLAKPPHFEKDIYYYLAQLIPTTWYIETWVRGKAIMTPHKNINEIQEVSFGDIHFQETQDHSKWAVTDDYVWIGDLNRMTSQYTRGGGGVLIKNTNLALAFQSLIESSKQIKAFSKSKNAL